MFVYSLVIHVRFSHDKKTRMMGKLLYSNWHNEHMGTDCYRNYTTHFIYIRGTRYIFDSCSTADTISSVVYRVML